LADGRFVQAETIVTEHFVAARCGDRSCGDRALQARWLEVAAEICRADFRYRGAADRFAQADERLSDADRDRRPLLKWRAARALLDAAWEFGDIDAAERARESFEGLAGRAGRKLPAGDRLRVTLEFGEAYLRLARLRGEPSDLAEARDILAEVVNDAEEMDDTTPLVIDAKSYLGLALHWLGEWTADPDACRRAVEQFEAVLGAVTSLSPDAIDEDTRRRVRSMLHHQVGLTLTRLGERESGDAGLVRLDEALTALDRAIADRGAEHDGGSLRDRRGWAESSNARLVTLLSKAERTGDTGLLWQAYAEAERVLKHRPRERVPLQWAATEANRANALAALARQTGERDRWRDAVAAYSAALECFDRDKTPFDWATTSGNLGIALLHTADSEDDLVEAERVLAEASSALSTERAPIQYGIILNTLGGCRAMLADARGDRAAMEAARATFEEAAATFTSAGAEAYLGQAEANIERANESLAAMA
jgi:tetratricopeptide (TPR) repeat protein